MRLFGVVHGQSVQTFFAPAFQIPVSPSPEILDSLRELRQGSRVGIEWMPQKDWQEVHDHLRNLTLHSDLKEVYPHYTKTDDTYWQNIIDTCTTKRLEVVFLENKDSWFRLNEAIMEVARRTEVQLCYEGESDVTYRRKLCMHNEQDFRAELNQRRIHELERDQKLLDAICGANLDTTLVGLAHSDYWMANREGILIPRGINVTSYSTQAPSPDDAEGTVFIRKAAPNHSLAFNTTSLRRALRLMNEGKLTDAKPTYVGIFDMPMPHKGYFEMIVDEQEGTRITGRIFDLIGDAVFKGTVERNKIRFTKKYTVHNGTGFSGEIEYAAERTIRGFIGRFSYGRFSQPFYMVEGEREDPTTLSVDHLSIKKHGFVQVPLPFPT